MIIDDVFLQKWSSATTVQKLRLMNKGNVELKRF